MKRRVISLFLVLCLLIPSFSVFAEEQIDVDQINEIINYIESYYNYEISRDELINGAYRGIMDTLDKHSTYFTEEEYKDFLDSLNGELIGIGIYVEAFENKIKVISPIEGMPASLAGIESGDIITHVDDFDVTGTTFEKAIDMIKGIEGTSVKITILRDGKVLNFNIVRKLIEIANVEYEMLENKIGYIKIVQFSDDVAKEFDAAVNALQSQGMEKIVLDLRNNPGGFLDQVILIADYFVDAGDHIIYVDYSYTIDENHYGKKTPLNLPTTVLINEGSASASEILAGAIKYNNKGTLIGQTTYGKGTVQNLIGLTSGDAMKLTTAEYYSTNKEKVNGVGITPDIIIEEKSQEALDSIEAFVPMLEDRVTHFGQMGLDVYGLQQRLQFLGYDVTPTGIFLQETARALEEFQKTYQLERMFGLYPETREALAEAIENYTNDDPQLMQAIEMLNE